MKAANFRKSLTNAISKGLLERLEITKFAC